MLRFDFIMKWINSGLRYITTSFPNRCALTCSCRPVSLKSSLLTADRKHPNQKTNVNCHTAFRLSTDRPMYVERARLRKLPANACRPMDPVSEFTRQIDHLRITDRQGELEHSRCARRQLTAFVSDAQIIVDAAGTSPQRMRRLSATKARTAHQPSRQRPDNLSDMRASPRIVSQMCTLVRSALASG
jgi:hypothetical protein